MKTPPSDPDSRWEKLVQQARADVGPATDLPALLRAVRHAPVASHGGWAAEFTALFAFGRAFPTCLAGAGAFALLASWQAWDSWQVLPWAQLLTTAAGGFAMNGIQWRGWLVAVAIFILGVGLGVAGTAWVGKKILVNAMLNPARPHSLADRAAERIGADLTKNLDLTPDQSAQVQAVLAQSASNLKTIRVQVATQTRSEMRSAAKQIAAILPPDKRIEFYRLLAKRYDRLGLTAPAAGENP